MVDRLLYIAVTTDARLGVAYEDESGGIGGKHE